MEQWVLIVNQNDEFEVTEQFADRAAVHAFMIQKINEDNCHVRFDVYPKGWLYIVDGNLWGWIIPEETSRTVLKLLQDLHDAETACFNQIGTILPDID